MINTIALLIKKYPIARRLGSGMLANVAGKMAALIVQFLNLAIMPREWGALKFGTWLMLTTVPTYLALSDLGFGNAAATDMTIRLARNDRAGALSTFHTIWSLISLVTASIGVAAIASLNLTLHLSSRNFLSHEVVYTSSFLILYSLTMIQATLTMGAYRATGKFALGTSILAAVAFIEGICVLFIVKSGAGLVAAAATLFLVRVFGHTIFCLTLFNSETWLSLGYRHFDKVRLAVLAKPAMASLGLSISSAAALQGIVVVLGFATTPAIAAAYSSARTLCRLPLQLTDVVVRTTLPELTSAFASGKTEIFDRLTLINIGASMATMFPFSLILAIFGNTIASKITGSRIQYDDDLFLFTAAACLFLSLWTAVAQSLVAMNKHGLVSFCYIPLAMAMAACPLIVAHTAFPARSTSAIVASLEFAALAIAIFSFNHARPRKIPVSRGYNKK